MDDKTKQALKQFVKQGGELTALGFVLVLSTALGLAIGVGLDRWLVVTRPWCTIGFILFGVVTGFYQVIQTIQRKTPGPPKGGS